MFSRLNISQLSAVVLKWPFLGLLKDFLGSVKAKTHQNLIDQFMVKVLVCLGHDLGPLLASPQCVLQSKTFCDFRIGFGLGGLDFGLGLDKN